MQANSINPSEQAERAILNLIQSGKFPEGSRLPNTAVLAAQLEIGANSVQQALARLSTLGYLERRPRMGTIVKSREKKPLSVMILVGSDLKKEPHYMDRRLTGCLEKELEAGGYIPHVHDNLVSRPPQNADTKSRIVSRLIQDFTLYKPAGIIESGFVLKSIRELSSEFTRPSVSIKAPELGGDISSDRDCFMKTAISRLAAAGRKRVLWVAKINGTSLDSNRVESFWSALLASPLECVHIIEANVPFSQNQEVAARESMTHFIRQNRALPPAKRADCVLVDEDILMRGVALALLSERVKVPEELLVCTHTNEGVDLLFGVPVIAYEAPISELARRAVQLLTMRIRRESETKTPILIPGKIKKTMADPLA